MGAKVLTATHSELLGHVKRLAEGGREVFVRIEKPGVELCARNRHCQDHIWFAYIHAVPLLITADFSLSRKYIVTRVLTSLPEA